MPTPQPSRVELRSHRALSIAGALLLRLLVRAAIAAVLVFLVAWTCVLRGNTTLDTARLLVVIEEDEAQIHGYGRGLYYSDFGVALADIAVDGERRTITPDRARMFREAPDIVAIDGSTSTVLVDAPTPPDTLSASFITTHSCGYPFTAFRAVSITYRSSRPATFVYTRDMWQDPLPLIARFGPPPEIHRLPSGPRGFSLHWGRHYSVLSVHWGHFPTSALPAFIQSRFVHNPNLPSHIPIGPYWPGLLTNTAIYTAIIWFLCWTTATTRRRIHRWRHPCANPCKHCRYDLTGITQPVCPECGHAIRGPA